MGKVKNLIGQKFGKLTVVEQHGFTPKNKYGSRQAIWYCLCDCGNYCEVQHVYLSTGDTTSCGCMRSKGEFQIAQLLKEHNIAFQQEYIFSKRILCSLQYSSFCLSCLIKTSE